MKHVLEKLTDRAAPIGIDIGATGVKLVQFSHSRSTLRLAAMTRIDLPEDAAADATTRLDTLIRAIGEKADSPVFSSGRCVVSVDDELLRVRSIRLPVMSDAEVGAAVDLDGRAQLGFASNEDAIIGWAKGGESPQGDTSKQEVLYIGAPARPLEHLAEGLASVGVRPVALEPGFIANARCYGKRLRRTSDQSVVRLLLDIGRRKTAVIFTRGDVVSFYKPLQLGGRDITLAAAERLGMEPSMIDDLRRQRVGLRAGGAAEHDPKVDRAVFEAARPLLEEIAHETMLCLRHYSVTFRGARPESCLLIGGEASEPGLDVVLQEALHLPTLVGDPFDNIETGLAPGERAAFSAWSVAAGLALHSVHNPISARGIGLTRRVVEPEIESAGADPAGNERSAA